MGNTPNARGRSHSTSRSRRAAALAWALLGASCATSSEPVVADVTFDTAAADAPTITDAPSGDAPLDALREAAVALDAQQTSDAARGDSSRSADATATADSGPDAGSRDASTGPCARGLANCGDGCVDLLTTNAHCGSCDIACPAAATCRNGECACPAGQALCGGECITPGAPCAWESPECAQGGVQCVGNTRVCAGMMPFAPAGTACEGRYQNMVCNGRGRCGCPDAMTCVWCEEACQTFAYCESHPVCP